MLPFATENTEETERKIMDIFPSRVSFRFRQFLSNQTEQVEVKSRQLDWVQKTKKEMAKDATLDANYSCNQISSSMDSTCASNLLTFLNFQI